MRRKPKHKKNVSITDGSAAQSAQNPTFLVHGVSVTTVPPSFRKDGARKRFSPSRSVPPPTGPQRIIPVILVRTPRRYRRGR